MSRGHPTQQTLSRPGVVHLYPLRGRHGNVLPNETEVTVDEREGLRWEPPSADRKRYEWSEIADMLRANPRVWRLVFEQDRASVVHAIRQETITALRPVWTSRPEDEMAAGFEVTTRNNNRGNPRTCDLYMRYMPAKRKRRKS